MKNDAREPESGSKTNESLKPPKDQRSACMPMQNDEGRSEDRGIRGCDIGLNSPINPGY